MTPCFLLTDGWTLQGLQGGEQIPEHSQEERAVGGQEEDLRQHGQVPPRHLLQVSGGHQVRYYTTASTTSLTLHIQGLPRAREAFTCVRSSAGPPPSPAPDDTEQKLNISYIYNDKDFR